MTDADRSGVARASLQPGSGSPSPAERLEIYSRLVEGLFYEIEIPSGRLLRSTGHAADLAGVAATEEEYRARVFPGDRGRFDRSVRGAFERGEPFDLEYGVRHPDGRLLQVRDRAVVLRDGAGRPSRLVGFRADATAERAALDTARAAERESAASAELYRKLFTLTPSGVVLLDGAGRIVAFNDQAPRQLGYAPEEFARLSIDDIDVYERGDDVQRHLSAIAAARGEEFEAIHVTRDGRHRTVLVNSRPIELGGEPRFLAVWQDVTDIRRADERVRRSEARYRALMERSIDVTVVVDAAGRVSFWSPNGKDAVGWNEEEVLGRDGFQLFHPDDLERARQALGRLLAVPRTTVTEVLRVRCKDGSHRESEITGRNLLDDPVVEGIVLNAHDVTERRRLEERYRHSQKLEAVGRLAGGVAHDFNNLLTVVLASVESLETDRGAGMPVDPDDIRHVRDAAERARDLTRQLLAFARKQVIAPVPLDLNAVVQGSERLLRRVLGDDVELVVTTQPFLWTVLADASQLEQVLMNLAVNARDAMPGGGRLTLETRNATVDEAEAAAWPDRRVGDWVRLLVTDTGSGLAPGVKEHIFEPFFTTKEMGKGTGLGLATVHGIVSQVGGHIHVESEVGTGTTFQVCLPRTLASPVPREARSEAAERPAGLETVLVVEDDPQVREVTARALERAGYRVVVAGGGAEALEISARPGLHLDLMVTDVVMPGMSGPATAAGLAKLHPAMEVLYVSGYTADAVIQRGVRDGTFNFLGKPFTIAALLARVRSILDARRAASEAR